MKRTSLIRNTRARVALIGAVMGSLGGCAVAPPSLGALEPVPVGTTTVFSRLSSGSYGTGTGEVEWTYGETTWQGQRVLDARNSAGGGSYHDPKTFGVVAALNASGQPVMSFRPPIALEFPLSVGRRWSSRNEVTSHPSGQTVVVESQWAVQAYERVQVPAGTFMAYKVVRVGSDGETETRWVGVEPGLPLVQRLQERGASHRQGVGRQEAQLVAYRLGSRAK